ncbi:MAG TPA: protease pro-enzyme activation domain-containing protein [Mycobacteriales bacterium]|nr:protease pro-enzyme activation domain-containing protein [Mycobacteriales bacterium]
MRRPALALGAAGALLIAAAGSAAAFAAHPGAPATRVLTGTVPSQVLSATRVGPVDPGSELEVGVTFAHPDVAGETAALDGLYTPGSATFHHFFTPASYAARFGLSPAVQSQARTWATSTGLAVAATSSTGDYLLLTGRVAQVNRLFRVTEQTYRGAKGTFRAPSTNPTVPAALPIAGVVGLDSLHVSAPAGEVSAAPRTQPRQTTCVGSACTGLTTPEDLWSTYDMPDGNRGSGQSIAIFGEGAVDPAIHDLRAFEKSRGLPRVNVVLHSVADDFKDTAGTGEWDIDMQASTSMAPDATALHLYWGKDLSDASALAVVKTWVSDPTGPLQASASYGECEASPQDQAYDVNNLTGDQAGVQSELAYEATMRQSAAEGRTLFSSTGDTGGGCALLSVDVNGIGQEPFPLAPYQAADPYVVAVGGTILSTDKDTTDDPDPSKLDPSKGDGAHRTAEVGWEYGGGGFARFVPLPTPNYQAGIALPTTPCLASPDGSPGDTGKPCKGTPDIAAQSGDVPTMNGYDISSGGNDEAQGGGTSLSSPLAVGMWTRIQAAAQSNLGFANYGFYAHPKDFFDVTVGATAGGTAAGPGWDTITGLGVPDVSKLMSDLAHSLVPAHPVTPKPTADPVTTVCAPSGVIVDPKGDATSIAGLVTLPGAVNDPSMDITKAYAQLDAAGDTVTFHIEVDDLANKAVPGEGQYDRWDFGFGGHSFEAILSDDPSAGQSFSLNDTTGGLAGEKTVLDNLKGAFDTKADEIRVDVPIAAFNAKSGLATKLGLTSSLTNLAVLTQRPESVPVAGEGATLTVDSADGVCPFLLGKAVRATVKKTTKPAAKGTGKSKPTPVTSPGGSLAATGLGVALPSVAVLGLIVGLGLVARRTRRQ